MSGSTIMRADFHRFTWFLLLFLADPVHPKDLRYSEDPIGWCQTPSQQPEWLQRIPRIIRQTHRDEWHALPKGMRYATESWRKLNPEYEYCYFNDTAMTAYMEAYADEHFVGLRQIFRDSPYGAMRSDIWRALVTYREGGVYADADTVLKTPLSQIIRPDDDAVSGVGHSFHGLEQFVLVYSKGHPVMRKLLEEIMATMEKNGGARAILGSGVMSATGPVVLKRVTAALLLNGSDQTPQFTRDGVYPVLGKGGPGWGRSVRILPGKYDCPKLKTYCNNVNTFGGNVRFKYRAYEAEQNAMGLSSYMKDQTPKSKKAS